MRWLLAAALLAGHGGAQDSDGFPLQAVNVTGPCTCVGSGRGVHKPGWSKDYGICMKGSITTCQDCPRQRSCATISSLAGDGVREYRGDCRAKPDQRAAAAGSLTCPLAGEASLSYPSSIAVDDEDNVYISDHGSNRIRMYRRSTDTMETIAGTGEYGFSGDGSYADTAKMRAPDGIAVRPGDLGSTVRKEVYFSDFQNQRIRKLVQMVDDDKWYIFTVAGTGEMGDNLDCDAGCGPLAAKFNFPRALAFSSAQDLYIVDSGNLKVRKMTSAVGAPSTDSPGELSTFVGLHGAPATRGESTRRGGSIFYPEGSSVYLPGHWEESNDNVAFNMVYHISVDNLDNLWVADSQDNRLMMVPLESRSFVGTRSDSINNMAEAYASKFAKSPSEHFSLLSAVGQNANDMILVLYKVLEDPAPVGTFTVEVPYEAGKSYWRYSQPVKGRWCDNLEFGLRDACKEVPAQYGRFQSIMGFCFDKANSMYVSDMDDSQVLQINRDHLTARLGEGDSAPRTTNNCQCKPSWSYTKDGVTYAVSDDTYCTTEGSHIGSAWCATPTCGTRDPADEWGFCRTHATGIVWEAVEGGAIVGGAMRSRLTGEVYEEVGDSDPDTASPVTLKRCQDNCALQGRCKAVMAKRFQPAADAAAGAIPYWKCVYFQQAAPFAVYPLHNVTFEFEDPITPYSIYFNATNRFGIDVGTPVGNETSLDSPDLVSPDAVYPESALLQEDCRRLCAANALCRGIAMPGCYLLNEQAMTKVKAGRDATTDEQEQAQATVYVKKFTSEGLTGIVGYPRVKTFQGEGGYVKDAYLNRPGTCAVNSRGDLIFADVWNMRVRTVTGLTQDCVQAPIVQTPTARRDWESAITNAQQKCTSSDHSGLNALVEAMQRQVVDELSTELLESHLCRWGNTSDPSLTGNYTDNTLVLCAVCYADYTVSGSWPTSPLCPWKEMCDCHQAIASILDMEIFKGCKGASAYHDRWHRWASGYVACLKDSEAAEWWFEESLNNQLTLAIQP